MAKKRKKSKSVNKRKTVIYSIAGVCAILIIGAGILGKRYFIDSFSDNPFFLYVDSSSTLESVLEDFGKYTTPSETKKLKKLAVLNRYNPANQPGAYKITPGMSTFRIYRKLSKGMQTPVRFTFNNLRTKEDIAESVGKQFMMGKDDILLLLNDSTFCADMGFDIYTVPALFLPDSYEMYWTISPRKFMDRMRQEYDRFWTDEKRLQATRINLTPTEVSTLASIVEEETKVKDEMNMVAGLYMNRLKDNMPLQADPTVKFAVGNFTLRRILHEHLFIDSPYNTYQNTGLPPGPIRIPSKTAINAVLNYTRHPFIYMCAKEDFSGRHNFAASYSEHQRNAARYHKALNARNIME